MKLNSKGLELAEVWLNIWDETVKEDIAENGDKYEGGWSVMYEHNKIHNADDLVGVLLAGYGEYAMDYVEEVCYGNGFCETDEYEFGISFGEYLKRLSKYFCND